MASKCLLLLAIIIAICTGEIHRKHHDALVKRQHTHRKTGMFLI